MPRGNDNRRRERLSVYSVREYEKDNGEKDSFWTRIGVAFVNRDDSLSVQLECLPVDGKLHIRKDKERDDDRRGGR